MPDLLFDDAMSGHDSQVESISIDPVAETVTVSLQSYPAINSKDRVPVEIVFSKVISVTTTMYMKELADNRIAGNVIQWHLAETGGVSYFSLTGGYLTIESANRPVLTVKSE